MNIVVVLAGGMGARLGVDIPKQYIEVGGKPIIGYCLNTFFAHPFVDAVQIVADVSWRAYILDYMEKAGEIPAEALSKWKGFSNPGANRQLSIFHALEDCLQYAQPTDYVLLHDAARPLVSDKCITACFEKVKEYDGVLPVLPMKDTVYLSEDGKRISSLVKREQIFAGQAPEAFQLGKYYEANKALFPERIYAVNGSTEPAILGGLDVAIIDGEEENFKITTKEDLDRFCQKVKFLRGQS